MPGLSPLLQGLPFLDMTQVLSGPYCTQVLGDLGAEVIKLEAPQGDLARAMQPHFVGPDSVYFVSLNRNKRSVVVDLKPPDGVELVARNNRPGVLARLGLRADELRRKNPKLIWCAISGFGQDGPYRDKPAYDMIVQALAGGMSLTGEPGGPPVRAGIPIGDIAAGLYATIAILAALNRRNATGQGETIDISILDCQAAMLTYQAAYFLHAGQVPARQGSGHDSIPIYRSFTGGDGKDFVVCAITETNWQALCRVLEQPALAEDPRFPTNPERYKHPPGLGGRRATGCQGQARRRLGGAARAGEHPGRGRQHARSGGRRSADPPPPNGDWPRRSQRARSSGDGQPDRARRHAGPCAQIPAAARREHRRGAARRARAQGRRGRR